MKRTVKGWAIRHPSGEIRQAYRGRRETIPVNIDDRIVPCTITYDDGRPRKRRKPNAG